MRLPESLKITESNAFNYCRSLTELVIPDGTIHLGRHAFFDCCGLRNVRIPSTVGFMGTDVFGHPANLRYCVPLFEIEDNPFVTGYLNSCKLLN